MGRTRVHAGHVRGGGCAEPQPRRSPRGWGNHELALSPCIACSPRGGHSRQAGGQLGTSDRPGAPGGTQAWRSLSPRVSSLSPPPAPSSLLPASLGGSGNGKSQDTSCSDPQKEASQPCQGRPGVRSEPTRQHADIWDPPSRPPREGRDLCPSAPCHRENRHAQHPENIV